MNNNKFEEISEYIDTTTTEVESTLDLATLTMKYGLQSFRYGSSSYIKELFEAITLTKDTVFYDLGSGYGRIILYGALQYPMAVFKGIEIISERNTVCESLIKKLELKNSTTECADFFDVDITDGTIFYIFNPLFESQYARLATKLQSLAAKKTITIIAESKCDMFDNLPWLQHYKTIAVDVDVRKKMKFYTSI